MKKAGFTLIELMVVIVIMGLLAAVAVPKLFGMIAKSKASEVLTGVGTWIHFQDAYYQERRRVGNWTEIGYNAPGIWNRATSTSTSSIFNYTGADDVIWVATPINALNECTNLMSWKLKASVKNDDVKTEDGNSNPECLILTPAWPGLEKNK